MQLNITPTNHPPTIVNYELFPFIHHALLFKIYCVVVFVFGAWVGIKSRSWLVGTNFQAPWDWQDFCRKKHHVFAGKNITAKNVEEKHTSFSGFPFKREQPRMADSMAKLAIVFHQTITRWVPTSEKWSCKPYKWPITG